SCLTDARMAGLLTHLRQALAALAASVAPLGGLFDAVVRRFFGDDDVVHVAFAHARGGGAKELGVALQGGGVPAPAVAHAGAQAADELMDHRGDAALVRDAPLDALGDQLVRGVARRVEIELVLEVAIAAAAAHRADRSHAAVLFEAPALIQDDFARALVGAG